VDVEAIASLWSTGKPLQAGAVIYGAIPNAARPEWAADILELTCSQVPTVPAQVQAVIKIARDRKRWREAHAAFSAVRRLTLAEEKTHSAGQVYECLLFVAQNTAKVVYNASGESAPFDEDSGDWLVRCLRDFADAIGSPEFDNQAWGLLKSWIR
jgi:hypothetical protein